MAQDFIEWYEEHHGYPPFPWQVKLSERFREGQYPSSITVPTGTGKTSIIAVWFWAINNKLLVSKRLIYVVDRRLIVDSVTDYAEKLGCKVIKMRGGTTIDNSWLMEPHKPAVIVSTVDQAGSRLLWRGYGVSSKVAPIHAALIGNDALIVLDEAHISTPFAETLASVKDLRGDESTPWHVITMSATPISEGEALGLTDEDMKTPVLRKRLQNNKLASLVKVGRDKLVSKMLSEAKTLMHSTNGVVGVICNTTKSARGVFDRLEGDKVLLTGRIRPADKDSILEKYLPKILSGSRTNREPLYVVATQTIEVGADLDFDALVTQSAPIDSLRQRFGRLDRLGELGESHAVIVHENLSANEECRVYGRQLLAKTWTWLSRAQAGKGKMKRVDFGLSAMEEILASSPPPVRDVEATLPFTKSDLRRLRQTLPTIEIDISPWLHGNKTDDISLLVVWREDLFEDTSQWLETVKAAPPVMAEAMPCPVYEVQEWLGSRPAVVGDQVVSGRRLRPGNLVVVPNVYGGYGPWGWQPESIEPVEDIGNQVGSVIRLVGIDEKADFKAILGDMGLDFKRPVPIAYPAGVVIVESNPRVNGEEVTLDAHLSGMEKTVQELTDDPVVLEAARKHDIGKQDPRFQVLLGAREKLLAKSCHPSPFAAQVAREWSGLPMGWRHEVASVAMLPEDVPDLLRYLVGAHHGHGRTVLPLCGDIALWERADGPNWGNMTERLNEEYGAWGLAYKEALVRLADWLQSKREQENAL